MGVAGDATFLTDVFTLTGSGVDIWDAEDSFHFVYRPLVGDAVITTKVESLANTDPWALAGVMIRQDLTGGSEHALCAVTPGNGISFTRRATAGSASDFTGGAAVTAPYWVRLTRTGNSLSAYTSANGTSWTQVGTAQSSSMTGTVYVGLALTSHDNTTLGTATFSNVLLTGPNVNNPPTISAIGSQSINEDTVLGPLAFTIGDAETASASLGLSRTSSVPALVALTNIVLGGSGSNRTVTVTPQPNAHGAATITVAVTDGTNTTPTSFALTVLPVNDAPVAEPDTLTRPVSQGAATPAANLLTNDTDAEGNALTLLSVNGAVPPGASVLQSNGVVTYWPPFGHSNVGSFSYVLTDGNGGAATGLVTVAVQPDPAGSDVLSITATNGAVLDIKLTGIPNFTYTVQRTPILTPANWQNITNVTADGLGQISIIDTMSSGTNCFYRAVRGLAP